MSDSYHDYDRDVSQRILHSETRIKNWVIGGVLANLVVLIGIGAPMVWYLGQLSAQTSNLISTMTQLTNDYTEIKRDQDKLIYRQRVMADFLRKQGMALEQED